jgi:hypothetical protein
VAAGGAYTYFIYVSDGFHGCKFTVLLGFKGYLKKKNGNIFPKMFGELKNVVFLQPQIERFSAAK